MFSFADSLDWGAAADLAGSGQSGFGTAFQNAGNSHDVSVLPWNARSVGNVNIYASLAAGFTGTPSLTRADNTYWGYGPVTTTAGTMNQYHDLDEITAPNHLVTFAGHFQATPATFEPTSIGEHLLGNISGNGSLVLNFDRNLSQIGFRIAANSTLSNTDFAATIVAYNGATIVRTYSMNVTGGGGICDPLRVAGGNPNATPPVHCNDAGFIAMDAGPQRFTSVRIFTSNGNNGFFINGLQFNSDEVPEPSMVLLMAGGLAGLWLFSTGRRRFTPTR